MNGKIVKTVDPYVLVNSRHGTMLANHNDIYIGRALIEYGEYCELEVQFLKRWIDHSSTVVEVGANIGSQTVALAKAAKAAGGDVVAFEPQPFVFQNLCANLALNAIDNVTAWPYACAAEPGTVWLESPNYRRMGNFGSVSVRSTSAGSAIQMPCVRLDDMLRGRKICLLKVDVEGFELQVLHGAEETLAIHRPVLYVENDRPEQSSSLIEHLWNRGYRLFWHITSLFNPDNFHGRVENIYPRLYAFNMVGFPREWNVNFEGGKEILDSTKHPHLAA